MSQADLRRDATEAAFDAFSIAVELLQGGSFSSSKVVSGIWVQPVTTTDLGGFDVQSDRPSRVLALRRSDAPRITRGDRLRAGDGVGGRLRNFRVDAPVEIFSDHYRLSLVPDNTAPPAGSSSGKSLPDREPAPDRKPTGPQKPPPHPQLRDHE